MFKTLKANGENCQIAYVKEIEAWSISSKNVCLIARTVRDVDNMKGDRFHFANLMAEQWFEILSKCSESTIKELKDDLNGKTIIGEYVGN